MNRYFYKGIRFKMSVLFSLIFMLINLAFGRVIYQYFKNSYVENYNKYLYSRGQAIIDKTEINPDVIALPDSGESIRVFYHLNEGRPKIVFQSPGTISQLNVPYRSGITDSLGQYGIYLKKENYDGRPVELMLTVSDQSLKQRLAKFTRLTIGITSISLIISSLLAFLASGWLLKPIRSIANQARGINTERLGERIKSSETHDELQQLSQTINEMIARIENEQQARNNFFAAASHELRTPLANLRAQTEFELMDRESKSDRKLLSDQLTEISRLQSIVEQFLLISEFNSKGITLIKSHVDIIEQLLKVFSRNQPEADKRNIKYNIHFSEEMSTFELYADGSKMELVWQNLIYNAIKYATENTILVCKVKTYNGQFCVTFENSIARESVEVYELRTPFSKGSGNTSGSGLGLWICNEIVQAHSGQMKLQSEKHCFFVTISIPI
ncbi:HAMP domain-containing sensor histidine kinase [Pedobacter roseus]|uniref:histidine kinase n=1 Tax=Pedobacter roseus TaxID=336820 RepID=A0A7G9QK53_9SPHI|nr:HAMP domain-containing sensor histidine kinase [Pedobacter roseus]QNN43728.1 HAMP domain-containing histidine kinase [Pedobacter roseus]